MRLGAVKASAGRQRRFKVKLSAFTAPLSYAGLEVTFTVNSRCVANYSRV